ncbi:unnamed protein product, partial [marine sediment metagenome]
GIAAAFRHCSVHARGVMPEPDVTSVLEKATGESFTGKKKTVLWRQAMVDRYFRFEGGNCYLQGIDHSQLKPHYAFVNKPTTDLMEKLVSHACLAYTTALMHFGAEPFWERDKGKPQQDKASVRGKPRR